MDLFLSMFFSHSRSSNRYCVYSQSIAMCVWYACICDSAFLLKLYFFFIVFWYLLFGQDEKQIFFWLACYVTLYCFANPVVLFQKFTIDNKKLLKWYCIANLTWNFGFVQVEPVCGPSLQRRGGNTTNSLTPLPLSLAMSQVGCHHNKLNTC